MTKTQLSHRPSSIMSKHTNDLYPDYEYTIPMAVQDLARLELREDISTLNESLAQFRDWIRKSRDVKNVQTGR